METITEFLFAGSNITIAVKVDRKDSSEKMYEVYSNNHLIHSSPFPRSLIVASAYIMFNPDLVIEKFINDSLNKIDAWLESR